MKYLITVVETYRIDNESEVEAAITEAKNDPNFTLVKYNREYKERKSKGDVVDSWYKLSLTKSFTDEKEPDHATTISYEA